MTGGALGSLKLALLQHLKDLGLEEGATAIVYVTFQVCGIKYGSYVYQLFTQE